MYSELEKQVGQVLETLVGQRFNEETLNKRLSDI